VAQRQTIELTHRDLQGSQAKDLTMIGDVFLRGKRNTIERWNVTQVRQTVGGIQLVLNQETEQ
jgi:hypothetical protein